MPKKSVKPTSALLVTPVVLVTCQDEGGRPNIITLAWVGVASSDPPMISVAIRSDRHSHGIIKRTGEFVVKRVLVVHQVSICPRKDFQYGQPGQRCHGDDKVWFQLNVESGVQSLFESGNVHDEVTFWRPPSETPTA